MRVRISRGFLTSRPGLALVGTVFAFVLFGLGFIVYKWISYGRMIDERLAGHGQQTTARIFAAPARIFPGENLTAPQLVSALQRSGYGPSQAEGAPGWYALHGTTLEVHPEPASYFAGKNALRVDFG